MTNEKLRYWITDTVRGPAALIGGSGGLRAVILPGLSREELLSEVRERFPSAVLEERGLTAAARSLARYFSDGRLTGRAPRLDLSAIGPFRRSVYEALLTIPSGEVVTYAELARRIGKPGAHRSVGTALSRNPILSLHSLPPCGPQ